MVNKTYFEVLPYILVLCTLGYERVVFGMPSACLICALLAPERLEGFYSYTGFSCSFILNMNNPTPRMEALQPCPKT
jgi:hypothetical protein